jgi:hypothetical protein
MLNIFLRHQDIHLFMKSLAAVSTTTVPTTLTTATTPSLTTTQGRTHTVHLKDMGMIEEIV